MRVWFLVIVALLMLALGELELVSLRHWPVADPLPSASISTPWR
jgi:hypothetical protein